MRVRNRAGKDYISVDLTPNASGGVHAHIKAEDTLDIEKDLKPKIAREGDELVVSCEVGPWGSDIVLTLDDFKAIKGLMSGSVVKWAIKAFLH